MTLTHDQTSRKRRVPPHASIPVCCPCCGHPRLHSHEGSAVWAKAKRPSFTADLTFWCEGCPNLITMKIAATQVTLSWQKTNSSYLLETE